MSNGPLTRYVKFWVAHAPGMPGTFFPPLRVSDPDMLHGTCVTHVQWCGFLWSRWRGKHSRHSRRMRNPQFHVSGKRPMFALPSTFNLISWAITYLPYTIDSRYIAVECNTILNIIRKEESLNFVQTMNLEKAPIPRPRGRDTGHLFSSHLEHRYHKISEMRFICIYETQTSSPLSHLVLTLQELFHQMLFYH